MQAKDAFFSCVTEQGVDFSVGAPVPQPCLEQRKAFEAACRASWVGCVASRVLEVYTCNVLLPVEEVLAPRPALATAKALCILQVRHFDILRDKEIRLVLRLQSNINKRAATAEGQLAGRAEK